MKEWESAWCHSQALLVSLSLAVLKSERGRGPGVILRPCLILCYWQFSHVSAVRIQRMVVRVKLCVGTIGLRTEEEQMHQVTYHTCIS